MAHKPSGDHLVRTRNLRPRAWRPVQVMLEGRRFFLHPDGKVYERKERKPKPQKRGI